MAAVEQWARVGERLRKHNSMNNPDRLDTAEDTIGNAGRAGRSKGHTVAHSIGTQAYSNTARNSRGHMSVLQLDGQPGELNLQV